jgi:chitodextrinase
MSLSRRLLPLLCLLSVSLVATNAVQAQTVSCTGVAAWNATTIYNPGDRVVYQNALYQVNTQIWNTPPTYCPSCGWYTPLGTCGGTVTDTTPPTVPTGLNSPSKTSSSVSLAWTASSDTGGSGLAGYDVFQNGANVGSSTSTSFTANGLAASTAYSFAVRARDGAGNVSAQSGAISVTTLAATTTQAPFGGTPRAIPGTIQAEDYDTGGEAVAYHDTTAGNSGGQYRSDGVDIEATTDTGGGFNVGWIDVGEWLEYTVNVATTGSYTLEARVASLSTGGTLHVEMDGVNVSGTVTLPSTGGWQNWTSVTKSVSLSAGSHVMRLAMDSAGFNVNFLRFTSGTTPTCSTLPGVPSGLSSPSKSSSSVSLSWNASTPGANCTVSYRVFQNGAQATQVSTTSATISGLAASTSYSFSVAAVNQFGSSAQSGAISVTTDSGGTAGLRFCPYIDVSPGSGSAIMQLASNGSGVKCYTLAFILGRGCTPSWFGILDINSAEGDGILARVNELKAAGGNVIISFGGAAAPELANACTDVNSLRAAYQAVINKYQPMAIDLDIEDFDPNAIDRRNAALAGVTGAPIHYTLGVLSSGMTSAQTSVLQNAKSHNVNVAMVNIMAMDYGQPVADMYGTAISAANATKTQMSSLGYGSAQLGITPMIGQNDSGGEVFTLANAQSLRNNAAGAAMLAFWSMGRDNGGCPGQTTASATCSGVAQSTWQFSSILKSY